MKKFYNILFVCISFSLLACKSYDLKKADVAVYQEYAKFKSPDLNTFNLHGRVKTMIEISEDSKKVYEFNPKGKLVSFKDESKEPNQTSTIKRNKGRIESIGDMYYGLAVIDVYEYNTDGSNKSYSCKTMHSDHRETYLTFTESGWPESAEFNGSNSYPNYNSTEKGKVSYSYTETDDNGNWTSRITSKTYTENVLFNLFEDDEEDADEKNKEKKHSYKTLRKITYYSVKEF